MCRNPMCKNFGEPFEPGTSRKHGSRYKYSPANERFVCKYCKQASTARSNRAIRPIVRHFLSESIPFADCPKAWCDNHGVNVFENFKRNSKSSPYRIHLKDAVFCRPCEARKEDKKTVQLGERRSVGNPEVEIPGVRAKAVPFIIMAFRLGARMRRAMFESQLDPDKYYTHLRRIGARLKDFHSWRTARLLDPDFLRNFSGVARIYTDVAVASLRRDSGVSTRKHRRLNIIISVLALNNTFSGVCATSIYVLWFYVIDKPSVSNPIHAPFAFVALY